MNKVRFGPRLRDEDLGKCRARGARGAVRKLNSVRAFYTNSQDVDRRGDGQYILVLDSLFMAKI